MPSLAPLLSAPPAARRSLRILVADDLPEIQQLLLHWLADAGHQVTAAATGFQVVKLLKEERFDLVVTDMLMPDGDAIDVIIGARRHASDTRVLVVSGGGRFMQAQDCLRLAQNVGADGVLLKPFVREQLLEAVDRVMGPSSSA